jgi:hypothetical protein
MRAGILGPFLANRWPEYTMTKVKTAMLKPNTNPLSPLLIP